MGKEELSLRAGKAADEDGDDDSDNSSEQDQEAEADAEATCEGVQETEETGDDQLVSPSKLLLSASLSNKTDQRLIKEDRFI